MTLSDVIPNLSNQEWRLRNLYPIQDKWAKTIHFNWNKSQEWFAKEWWYFTELIKSRQHGFSTWTAIRFVDDCIWCGNVQVGLIDKGIRDAKEKLKKALFAYDNMGLTTPGLNERDRVELNRMLKDAFPIVNRGEERLGWKNGSQFSCSTNFQGGTLQRLWCSEFGYIALHRPKDAEKIISGGIPTVAEGNRALLEFTWEGLKAGEAWRITEEAMKRVGLEHAKRQWKLLFISFLDNSDNVENVEHYTFRPAEEKVFKRWAAQGVVPTLQQKAFWAEQSRNLPAFSVFKHFPAVLEDVFLAPVEGAIYAEILMKRETQGRVCDFDVSSKYPSYVVFDLGGANTGMWHVQMCPDRYNWLNYKQFTPPLNLAECARTIDHWHDICPVSRIILPHDAEGTEKDGSTFVKEALKAGLKNIRVLKQTPDVWIGISELSTIFETSWFHERIKEKFKVYGKEFSAWDFLQQYRIEQVPEGSTLKRMPCKDLTSHCCDAARYFAEAKLGGVLTYAHAEQSGGIRPRLEVIRHGPR